MDSSLTMARKKFPYPGYYFLRMMRDPLRLMEEIAAEGDLVTFRAGSIDFCQVNHADCIKEILVTQAKSFVKGPALQRAKRFFGDGLLTSEGDFHRRQRRLSQAAFHRQRLAAYGAQIAEIAQAHFARWQDGSTLDIHREIQRLALRIVGATLFGINTETTGQHLCTLVDDFVDAFPVFMLPYFEKLAWLPIPALRRVYRARNQLRAFIEEMIAARRRQQRTHEDLLGLLMSASDPEEPDARMNDAQLCDEVLTLIAAGYETVANAMTWALYELAGAPEIEQQLHQELDARLADRPPGAWDPALLPFTGQVFAEALRLYPPIWTIARRAQEAITLGRHRFPTGTLFLTSQWVMHHDPRYFAQPRRFFPDHFSVEAKQARPRFAFFPFGAGPRQCIGDGFAWTEGILVLAALAQRFRLRRIPGQQMLPQATITVRPSGGTRMRVELRAAQRRVSAA